MRAFLLGSAAAGVVSALVYWAYAAWALGRLAPPPDEAVAASVALVLGTAVSFAGALVAIVIASVALRLQQAQDRREDLQASIELLRLLSEETSRFLTPYARALQSARKVLAVVEIHRDSFWAPLDRQRLLDPAYAADPAVKAQIDFVVPHLASIAAALRAMSEQLSLLHTDSHANPFASAVFQRTLGHRTWCTDPGGAPSGEVGLDALPTVCGWLELKARQLDGLAAAPTGDLLAALVSARMLANSARTQHGEPFDDAAVRGVLLLGFLADAVAVQDFDLRTGSELRSPLAELLHALASAYDTQRVRQALCAVLADHPLLAASAERFVALVPSPVDAQMQACLTRYGALRPRVRLTASGFA
ncbi:hypothetical protein MOJ79_13520 [Calidifontimicrobium sp. SYSU G02091]|uniref:hypothetical protein n=1 Tax=Calidifontimicrobium sp. SYSU G02091 TaxID=2926421 RepID=UPI001F53CC18|nr:hypothetical protein [Calidifontimicrobium sp. SYSU G02091]MCI1192858.1 hypothetical protein [Calidifontimicrobium sp. SYSU G02091]